MKTLALLATLLAAGCLQGKPPEYSGPVRVASPELVRVNPDVQTLADSDQPIFYVRNAYWLFHDGGWYRAPKLDATWTKVEDPPVAVAQIDQPYAYTHFRKQAPGRVSASEAAATAVETPIQPASSTDQNRSEAMFPAELPN